MQYYTANIYSHSGSVFSDIQQYIPKHHLVASVHSGIRYSSVVLVPCNFYTVHDIYDIFYPKHSTLKKYKCFFPGVFFLRDVISDKKDEETAVQRDVEH